MTLADEFEIYDSTTADCLQNGDLIFYDGEYIEINLFEDLGTVIKIEGYSYTIDEEVDKDLNPDERLNLYKFAD